MDRLSNNRMYILFTESHKILVNSIYLFQTYERRWNGGIKNILGAGSNFRRVKLKKYFWKKILLLTLMEPCSKLVQLLPNVLV